MHFEGSPPKAGAAWNPWSVLAILNDGGNYRLGFAWRGGVQVSGTIGYGSFRAASREEVLQAARRQWLYTGATNHEAKAFVTGLQETLLGHQGLLCVYPLPEGQIVRSGG
ncbi:MAG: hypothetical protein ACKVHP_25080, partial [Verrucomicrobiales bacterium]